MPSKCSILRLIRPCYFGALLCAFAAHINAGRAATPGEDIVIDPQIEHGFVDVTYTGSDSGERTTARIPLRNQVKPTIRATVKRAADGRGISYGYSVRNAEDAPEAIANWELVVPENSYISSMSEPVGWQHGMAISTIKSMKLAAPSGRGAFLSWYIAFETTKPIVPGATTTPFTAVSK